MNSVFKKIFLLIFPFMILGASELNTENKDTKKIESSENETSENKLTKDTSTESEDSTNDSLQGSNKASGNKYEASDSVNKSDQPQDSDDDSDEKDIYKESKFNAVELNFENANLQTFLNYIEDLFKVRFLTEDSKQQSQQRSSFGAPQAAPVKNLSEIKINFKSSAPMKKNQIWSLVDLFLDSSGYARVLQKNIGSNVYRIISIPKSNKTAIPSYIGTEINLLPETGRIRYVYFAKNAAIQNIKDLVTSLKSQSATLDTFTDLKAIMLTDNAYNVKSLMKLVKEIDTASTPEILSVLKLQNSEASDVVNLYESLREKDQPFKNTFQQKKMGSFYFPAEAKVIAEPRTNSLIILGSKDAVYRIEDFVSKYLDSKLKELPSPIHIYELNYAPAEQLADILNKVTTFGQDWSQAAEYGGVRGGQKFFSKMFIQPDTQGNRLLIRGSEEDFKLIKPTIASLDQIQQQVAIEVLIVNITLNKDKAIYSAIRNRNDSKVNFQTSGFYGQGIQVNQNPPAYTGSLITNLINLATSASIGSTVLSLGKDSVWALLSSLEQITELNIISNPFLVATNKYKSQVSLGQTRRVVSGTVFGGQNVSQEQLTSLKAALEVNITPQINTFGIINLDIEVKIEEFTDADTSNGNKSTKVVKTNANVADGEILALGGLVKNKNTSSQSEVPILGRIPIIGYLFKNKLNEATNDNLLIFMTPRIIRPKQNTIGDYTNRKANYARGVICEGQSQNDTKDPIYQLWFKDNYDQPMDQLNNFVNKKQANKIKEPKKHFSLLDKAPSNKGPLNA